MNKKQWRQLLCRQVVVEWINNTYAAYANLIIFCLTLHAQTNKERGKKESLGRGQARNKSPFSRNRNIGSF